jgi:ribosomal protein S8E
MARKFKSEEEKKEWGRKMAEIRAKKRLERQTQSQPQTLPKNKPNLPSPDPGYIWVRGRSGDVLMLPQWLAEDMIKKGDAEKI